MAQWTPLNPETHADAGWHRYHGYQFAAHDHLAPVVMTEITQILPWYPLALALVAPERYQLVALLSLTPGRNLYVSSEGKWLAPYIPSHFRGYPFTLDKDVALCIDADSGLYSNPREDGAIPIYQHGELTEQAAKVKEFHQQRQQALALTQGLTRKLQAAELITPWTIQWKPADTVQRIKGYCTINEDRLRSLPPDLYAQLAHTGALGLAYLLLFSQPRIADLQFRHQRMPAPESPSDTMHHLHELDSVDSLFGEGRDDLFKFD